MPNLDSEALDFRAASESSTEFRNPPERNLNVLELLTIYQES